MEDLSRQFVNSLQRDFMKLHTLLLSAAVLLLAQTSFAAEQSRAEKQRELIAILKSDAPPQDKAVPCKQLAVFGDKEAVPALAPLLSIKDLHSWARIALENIPGPEADAALREAMGKLEGNMLIGVINSIGIRRDAKAVDALASKLDDSNPEIVGASAAALGNISGSKAASALSSALPKASKQTVSYIAEGMIVCAEQFMNDGKYSDATKLYDAVRKADVPKQRWLEATRGAILARRSDGLPLLIEQLRSPERLEFGMALRTARELKGEAVTKALAVEMGRTGSDREVMLLLAISDRNDSEVFPILLNAAEKKNKGARAAALALLDRFGNVSAVPVLLSAAAEPDEEINTPAKATLTRMEGKAVDDALLKQLPNATGKKRQVLIELAALRRIEGAVPAVVPAVKDSDPGVRRAALATLSALGTEQHIGNLVTLLMSTKEAAERESIEQALTAIAGRAGAASLKHIAPLSKSDDPELRTTALHAYATVGGSEALAAVSKAVDDTDESVRDAAVGTLATWPNNWPDDSTVAEPLMNLIKSGKKRAHQVQGVRGYLLHIQENKKLSNPDKVAAIDSLLPLLKQSTERKLAVSALGNIPTGKSIQSLSTLATDPALAEEANLAIVTVASARSVEANKESRKTALEAVVGRTKNEATRKKATDALNKL